MHKNLKVTLSISGFSQDPSYISKFMNKKPTKIYHEGKIRVPGSTLKNKENIWTLRSACKDRFDSEKHILELLNHYDRLRALRKKNPKIVFGINCIAYIAKDVPSFHLAENTITALAKIKCYVDIDIYKI